MSNRKKDEQDNSMKASDYEIVHLDKEAKVVFIQSRKTSTHPSKLKKVKTFIRNLFVRKK
jgi:hypothetical protein